MLTIKELLKGGFFQSDCIIVNVRKSHKTSNDIPVYKVVFLLNIENELYTFNATTQDWTFNEANILQFDYICKANIKFTYYPYKFRCKIHSINNLQQYDKEVL